MDLDTTNTHTQTLKNGEIVQFECVQKDTLQRIFKLWRDTSKQQEQFQRQLISRDQRIKDAFDQVNTTINTLIGDLEKRKLINNYNEKEKQQLKAMIEDAEDTDDDLYGKVERIESRLISVETKLPDIIDKLEDTAGKYDRMFWLLVAFFLLFLIKTFIWGY